MVFDSLSMTRLLITNNMKNMTFYMLDKNWKILKQFDHPVVKNSNLSESSFTINGSKKTGDIWNLITSDYRDSWTKENIDFGTSSLSVGENYLDVYSFSKRKDFFDIGRTATMFMKKEEKDVIIINILDKKLDLKKVALNISSTLPLKAKKQFNAESVLDIMSNNIENFRDSNNAVSSEKVTFYNSLTEYAIVIVSDEDGLAEITYFDKENGKKIKQDVFQITSLIAEADKKDKVRNITLLHDDKFWVVNASKKWGIFSIYDLKTKKIIYSLRYDEKSTTDIFNYPPTKYLSKAGIVTNVSKNKEKIQDVDMASFCKVMFENSSFIAILKDNNKYNTIKLGNFEFKKIMTNPGVEFMHRKSSYTFNPDLYTSTTAGLFLEKNNLQQTNQKITWNEFNDKNIGKSYSKVPSTKFSDEYDDNRAYKMGIVRTNDFYYVIYYYEKEIKIAEEKMN